VLQASTGAGEDQLYNRLTRTAGIFAVRITPHHEPKHAPVRWRYRAPL